MNPMVICKNEVVRAMQYLNGDRGKDLPTEKVLYIAYVKLNQAIIELAKVAFPDSNYPEISTSPIINDLRQIVLDNSTWKTPCDNKHMTRCCPAEEQEIGREQVLDEIRALIDKYSQVGVAK